ncbi:MMPL family transporter [Streptomyces sp. WMMC897]|uniref:MMPL family transporter n=1 Tax=Streptomyces sp. WMMC897 TaxID=3014782 RepID=UPI0022B730A2|nr:MMPL family transporter [Streptomyces sp. WMMC897]MCZ7414537.1 MMPL family transporter [Streptomyces sp. WMMC897]
MLDRLATTILARPRKVLLWTLVVVLCLGGLSAGVSGRLTMGGYESPDTESAAAQEILDEEFEQGRPNLTILVTAPEGIDDPEVERKGLALTERLQQDDTLANVVSYWSTGGSPALRGEDGKQALVSGNILGDFDDVYDRSEELKEEYTGTVEGLQVKLGGAGLMLYENTKQASEDSAKAESLVFPVVLVALVVIFGSLVAATLPLAVAFATLLVVLGIMFGITFLFEANNFLLNITVFLGLGLAIDYSLLFITRYREELKTGASIPDAIRSTTTTVGRTILFSAVTLAVAFLSLLVMPFAMFQSVALAGTATALAAGVATLVIVPALLAWAGPRIDRFRLVRRKERPEVRPEEGFWHRLAITVMRRPVPVLLGVLVLLGILAAPVANMNLRLPDEQVLPTSAQSYEVSKAVADNFDNREHQAMQVVADGIGDPAGHTEDIGGYAARLSELPDVARVDALTGSYADGAQVAPPTDLSRAFATDDATYLSVVPAVDGLSDEGAGLVRDVRGVEAPFDVQTAGTPAVSVDTFDIVGDRLPLALSILVLGTFVLLFLLTGSVLMPVKAILLSLLSLSATFGALVFVFQEGRLQWLVGDFVVTGALNWTVPILICAIAFGLSMDYEIFMISRIKEEYDRTGDNELSVAAGLERVGRVITYAAVVLSLVFVVLITSGISYMKAIGVGLPLAILMDATLIRGGLLPAFMRLMGRANWWAPGWMRALHARFGISEAPSRPAGEGAEPSRRGEDGTDHAAEPRPAGRV